LQQGVHGFVCLRCAAALLSAPLGEATAQLAEELFEVTACYFPITFTPPPNDKFGITADMLRQGLCQCLTCRCDALLCHPFSLSFNLSFQHSRYLSYK
jgi:hypothetical protein